MPAGRKGLVVSGGGARGAWAVGVLKYLMIDKGQSYDITVGTSTGSLIAPFAAIGDIAELDENYASIREKDILGCRIGLRSMAANAVFALLLGRDSIYTTEPLRRTIRRQLTSARWQQLKDPNRARESWICAVDLQTGEIRYFGSPDFGLDDRERFIDCMVASSSIPFFMSRARIAGEAHWFVDGGVKEVIPVRHCIERGATDITVISLGKEQLGICGECDRLHEMVMREIELSVEETERNDVHECQLITKELDWRERLRANLKRTCDPQKVDEAFRLTLGQDNPLQGRRGVPFEPVQLHIIEPAGYIGPSLGFEPEIMKGYVQQGYDFARQNVTWLP